MITISPPSVETKWNHVDKTYSLNIDLITSFKKLTSVKCKQPKNGLLTRRDFIYKQQMRDGVFRDVEKVNFTCTTTYNNMVEEGLLLVIDEVHNIKNNSIQTLACQTLVEKIIKSKGLSRVIFLSGSPIDSPKQAITFFKTINVFTEDRITSYNPQSRQIIWRGMQEIEDYCANILPPNDRDYEMYNIKLETCKKNKKKITGLNTILDKYCYMLFLNIIKPYYSHQMTIPQSDVNNTIHKYNAFYNLKKTEAVELLKKGINKLRKLTRYNDNNGTVDFNQNQQAISQISVALQMIETAKIYLFILITQYILSHEEFTKVVICVNYTATLNDLKNALSTDYSPLILCGNMNVKQRTDVLNKYQEPNNNFRLLIANIQVASCGIDLDDKSGKYKRFVLISPNFRAIDNYQLSHRFKRMDTKSETIMHMLYCVEAHELPILDALSRKGKILKEIASEQVKAGIVFPCDYDTYTDNVIS